MSSFLKGSDNSAAPNYNNNKSVLYNVSATIQRLNALRKKRNLTRQTNTSSIDKYPENETSNSYTNFTNKIFKNPEQNRELFIGDMGGPESDSTLDSTNTLSPSKPLVLKKRFQFFSKKWIKESGSSTVDLNFNQPNIAQVAQENISSANIPGQSSSKSINNIMNSFRRRIGSQKRSRSNSNRNLNRDKLLNNQENNIETVNRISSSNSLRDLKSSISANQEQLSSYYISDLQDARDQIKHDEFKNEVVPLILDHPTSNQILDSEIVLSFDSTQANNFLAKGQALNSPLRDNRHNLALPICDDPVNQKESIENLEKNLANIPPVSFGVVEKPQPDPLFYELKINLKEGINLAVRDITGTSDPYVKFILNETCIYKSRIIFKNLNPVWNEEFIIKLSKNSIHKSTTSASSKLSETNSSSSADSNNLKNILSKYKLKMFVYDYDRGFLNDDLIGYSDIELLHLKDTRNYSIQLELEDKSLSRFEYLGLVSLDLSLIPKYENEDNEDPDSTNILMTTRSVSSKSNTIVINNKRQCVLNLVLVEGRNLKPMDENGLSDPYVKFRIDNDRYRSKIMRKTLNPRFEEQFQMYINDMTTMNLQVEVFDFDSMNKSDAMGKANIDLKSFEFDKTHFVQLDLGAEEFGNLYLYLTVTGLSNSAAYMDDEYISETHFHNPYQDEISENYGLTFRNTFKNMTDVGWLRVKVIRAEGLASADINGKSDPFCLLSITNKMVQTRTEYKTLNPEWNKIFEFSINDLHEVLEINVLDEDKNKVYEFLGKIEIPVINVQNGIRKAYALKDKKLLYRTKGIIELEMFFVYNPLKAVVKTFNPRDEKIIKTIEKFRVPILKRNIRRVHNIVQAIMNTIDFIYSQFKWENPAQSFVSLMVFIIVCVITEIYMLPLFLLLIFAKNYLVLKLKSGTREEEDIMLYYYDEDEDADPDSKDQKKGFKDRLNEIQEICLKIQTTLDYIAGLGERVINTFNFTVPWLSWLAIITLIIVSLILYMFPLRYLILVWGINKFTKILRKPKGYIDNTELLDFLSRVPSNQDIMHYKEIKFIPTSSSVSSNSGNSKDNAKTKRAKTDEKKLKTK